MVFAMGLLAILPRRICELLRRGISPRFCDVQNSARRNSQCMRLAKFSGGALLEILSL
ncbi:hypothetical protein CAMGR0001_1344 [Campylobacter gracilis RM3268]|uniref:Uncharacterized protein n=1 Tax=Campylobacter gracilis RM3268 TaxID=553220 RepID=C8PJE5_9BACT|nr:hypothetical protein CAMGR0001_1344 [Campylobacter gracilis RM3268]